MGRESREPREIEGSRKYTSIFIQTLDHDTGICLGQVHCQQIEKILKIGSWILGSSTNLKSYRLFSLFAFVVLCSLQCLNNIKFQPQI